MQSLKKLNVKRNKWIHYQSLVIFRFDSFNLHKMPSDYNTFVKEFRIVPKTTRILKPYAKS